MLKSMSARGGSAFGRRKTIILTLILVISFVFGSNILAIGQVTGPIVIEDALRGEDFQDTLMIINTENQSIEAGLMAEGEIAEWIKFYKTDDLENPISDIFLTSNEKRNVSVIFSIPEDMPNGEYTGLIGVLRKPDEMSHQEGSSVSLAQRIDREVTIKVGGEENIDFTVSVIPKSYDVAKNKPLKIRFIYDNQGNVSIRPAMDLKIFALNEEGKKQVYSAIFPYPEAEPKVKPGSQHEISNMEIPTTGLEIGKYLTEIKFLHNDEIITEEDFKFSIKHAGSVLGVRIFNLDIFWPIIILVIIVAVILIIVNLKKKKKND